MSLVWGGEGPLPPQFCRGICRSPRRRPQQLLRASRHKGANTQSSPRTNAPRKVNRKLSAPGLKPLTSQGICGPFTPDFSWGPLGREGERETAVDIDTAFVQVETEGQGGRTGDAPAGMHAASRSCWGPPAILSACSLFCAKFYSHANWGQIQGRVVSRRSRPWRTFAQSTWKGWGASHIPQAPLCGGVSLGTCSPGTGSQPGEFASLCAPSAMSAGFVVVTGWGVWGTGLDAAINTLRHRAIPQPSIAWPQGQQCQVRAWPDAGTVDHACGHSVGLWRCHLKEKTNEEMRYLLGTVS